MPSVYVLVISFVNSKFVYVGNKQPDDSELKNCKHALADCGLCFCSLFHSYFVVSIIIGSKFHLMLAKCQCTFSQSFMQYVILFSALLFIVSYSFSCEFFFIIILLLHISSFLLTLLSVILYLALLSFFAFDFLCVCFCFSLHFLSFLFSSLATFCHLFPSFLFECHLFSILYPLSIWFYFLNFRLLPNRMFLSFFLL